MIPESILKKEKVSAKGDVTVNGNLKGLYGKGKMPLATLKIEINDASAQYADNHISDTDIERLRDGTDKQGSNQRTYKTDT